MVGGHGVAVGWVGGGITMVLVVGDLGLELGTEEGAFFYLFFVFVQKDLVEVLLVGLLGLDCLLCGGFVLGTLAGYEPLEVDFRVGGEDGGKLLVADGGFEFVAVEEAALNAGTLHEDGLGGAYGLDEFEYAFFCCHDCDDYSDNCDINRL